MVQIFLTLTEVGFYFRFYPKEGIQLDVWPTFNQIYFYSLGDINQQIKRVKRQINFVQNINNLMSNQQRSSITKQYFHFTSLINKNKQNFLSFMSSKILQANESRSYSELGLKQLNSLSTLTNQYSSIPHTQNTSFNLLKFKTVEITEKIKQKILTRKQGKCKRNQSMSNVFENRVNPEDSSLYLEENKSRDLFLSNKQAIQQKKTNKFFSMFQNQKNTSRTSNNTKLDMTLPVIKKQCSTKRANYLEVWLDQALDPQETFVKQQKQLSKQQQEIQRIKKQLQFSKTDNTFLATVKKFKIDKQYLRSQNIPSQMIQRLYNTLFIYTHGINNIFSQLLSFVDSSTQQQPRDSKIITNFWKSFIRLLEGCTSFQTTFQKVEEKHLGKINELKDLILKRQEEFLKEKEELNKIIFKQEKQILELNNLYSKLETDNKVTVATLELTDDAFNQQVQLRLKFEQKVNHVYTSYQQLKTKYQTIIHTLHLKNQQSVLSSSIQMDLKEKLRLLQGELLQQMHLLSQQKRKVKQRQQQTAIIKAQLFDFQKKNQISIQKQQEQQDAFQITVNKNTMLKTKVQTLENKVYLMDLNIKQMQQRLKQQNNTIQNYRKLNEQLHTKCNSISKCIAEYQKQKIYHQNQITRLSTQLRITNDKLQISQQIKKNQQIRLQKLNEQLQEKKYQIQTKVQAIQKINDTINDLKSIKDKYQRLFNIIQKQKEDLEKQKNSLEQKFSLEKQQIIGLKMLQESREKYIREIQAKHDKERQLLKRKVTGYNQLLTKKQSHILNYQRIQEEKNEQILNKTYRIQKIQLELNQEKVKSERKTKENAFLLKKLEDSQKLVLQVTQKLKDKGLELEAKIKQNDLSKQQIEAVSSLLKLVKQQQNSSITNLTALYKQYRAIIIKKGQHIHPMVYEDLSLQFNRAKLETIPRLQKSIQSLGSQNQLLKKNKSQLQNIVINKTTQIQKLQKDSEQKKQKIFIQQNQITKMNSSITQQQTIISQQSIRLQQLSKILDTNQTKISDLSQELQVTESSLQKSNELIEIKSEQIQKLNKTLEIVSDKLFKLEDEMQSKTKYNPYLIKAQKLEKQVVILTEELNSFKNVVKIEEEVQTQPENQVVINRFTPKFDRKNKFSFEMSSSKSAEKQVQAVLPPYDSIPQYIDTKISQIQKKQKARDEMNETKMTFVLKSKQQMKDQKQLRQENSLTKINSQKVQMTRREELRKALRFTYMRR